MGKIITKLSDFFVLSCFAGSLYFLNNTFKNNKYGFRPEHFDDNYFLTNQGWDYNSHILNLGINDSEISQLFISCVDKLVKMVRRP